MRPRGGHAAANGFSRCADPVQVFNHLRGDAQVAVAVAVLRLGDAGERLIKPRAERPEHGVIVRIHRRPGLVLPKLPKRRRAVLDHEAPARISFLDGEFIGEVRAAVARQEREQIFDSDKARGDMRVVRINDVGRQAPQHSAALFLGCDIEE